MAGKAGDRLTAIEARLAKIEAQLSPKPAVTAPASAWVSAVEPVPFAPPNFGKPGNWLGIVAVICFVLAAAFIVKLSIDSGWLTPARQVGLAAIFGLGLIGVGFALLKTDREFASFLPGAGVIVLYLCSSAAHRYYPLISFETAIAAVSLVSAGCIGIFTRIRHDVYAVTAAVGAYVSPNLLGLHAGVEFSLYYFLLCSVAYAAISIWLKARTLTLVSAYLAMLMTAFVGLMIDNDLLVAAMLGIHFLVFAASTYLFTLHNRAPLTEADAWSFMPALVLFYASEYYFLDRIQPDLAPWISLAFAGVLMGLYFSAKRFAEGPLASQSVVFAFTALVCFHSVYLELLPGDARPWLFVLMMMGAAFAPFKWNAAAMTRSRALVFPMVAALAVLAIEYVTMVFNLLDAGAAYWLVVCLAAFASIWACILKMDFGPLARAQYLHPFLVAAHLLAILGLYRLTADLGSLAVSASWLFYAVAVMAVAFGLKDVTMVTSALVVLGLAAGKALLYDAASAPTLVRIACLLLTGAVLYGCGMLVRKAASWKVAAG